MTEEYCDEIAAALEARLPDNYGFMLFITPFGKGPEQSIYYLSNMARESSASILKTALEEINKSNNLG